jgi:hypothetical protein
MVAMLLRFSFSRTNLVENAHISVDQAFVRILRIPDFHVFLLFGDLQP